MRAPVLICALTLFLLPLLAVGCALDAVSGDAAAAGSVLNQLFGGFADVSQADGNANGNDNSADDGVANDNGGNENSNDNGDGNAANGNDNGADHGNDNDNGNANDNGDDGMLCADGSHRARAELGDSNNRADYRLLPGGCERFELRVRGLAPGTHAVQVNQLVVGQITVDADGRGEVRWQSDDATLPSDFPMIDFGDEVSVGGRSGTFERNCSVDDVDDCGNSNANTNDNGG